MDIGQRHIALLEPQRRAIRSPMGRARLGHTYRQFHVLDGRPELKQGDDTVSAYSVYRLSCTRCGSNYPEQDENLRDLRRYAKQNGWVYKKVENGSMWDFCPRCQQREKSSPEQL